MGAAPAESGVLIGVGGAGRGLRTERHPVGSIESYMGCVEYCIDHVGCGPDTLYGAHQALYGVWLPLRRGHYRRPGVVEEELYPVPEGVVDPGYVKGLENLSESVNVARWMILHGYSDGEIKKVVGGNALRLLETVWV